MMEDDQNRMTDLGRQSAHILLDAIAAWDGLHPNDFTGPDLAIQRLLDIGAVRADHNVATGHTDIDISALLQGATTTMVMLIAAVASAARGATMLDVITRLREQVDALP